MKGGKPSQGEEEGRSADMAAPQRGVRVERATRTAAIKEDAMTTSIAKLPLCALGLIGMLLLTYAHCARRL
jgi:hypothetical protein